MASNIQSIHDDHDDHNDHDDDNNNTVIIAKITAMIVLFCASTFFGFLPYKLSKWFKWNNELNNLNNTNNTNNNRTRTIISLLLSFGGGVLLSTTFLHLLPEVTDNILQLQELERLPKFTFHFAEFLMCCGFFTMYFIEELITKYLRYHENLLNINENKNNINNNNNNNNSNGAEQQQQQINVQESQHNEQQQDVQPQQQFCRNKSINKSIIIKKKLNDIRNGSVSETNLINNSNDNVNQLTTISTIDINKVQIVNDDNCIINNNNNINGHQHIHSHSHSHIHLPQTINNNNNNNINNDNLIISSLRGLLIVLALSIHELFEGLAIGLESSSENVWYMFGAVSAHKLVLAFCVGIELIINKTRLLLILTYIIMFAIVSPIGIGIGILLSYYNNDDSSSIPSVILQGLATGTLLYVVFFEILTKNGRTGLLQFSTVLLGFFIMFGLQFATGHQHSHGGEHSRHSHNVKYDEHSDHEHINHQH